MDSQLKIHMICILSRMLLDRDIVYDCTLVYDIEGILSTILDSIGEDAERALSTALKMIYSSVEDSELQLQLLRHLPSFSPRQALFRRRLALAFFYCDEYSLSEDRKHLIDLKAIRRRLSHSRFTVHYETDYPGLAASIAVLAIGLDDGDPPPIDACKDDQVAFNESIDVLAQKIKGIDNQIIDTSASHRKRTEAKEVVDSFHKCLICAVRTQQKPRSMIWGEYGENEKQRSIMKNFFQKDSSAGNLD
ncbi:MAG: hypothetical protein Q9179_003547 [Wetmoreana sp. 5 TL-2023]